MTIAHDRLSHRHYRALAGMVERHAGIRLPPAKQTMVEGRLRRRVRALGLADLDAYAAMVLGAGGLECELVHLIDCVTTNKTDFFREPAHFEFLRDQAIPALVSVQGRQPARIKIWSAACSTGAEAYTIAMVLQDLQDRRQDFDYSILGTDISTEVLAAARAAIYSRAMVDAVPAGMRARYVMAPKDLDRQEVRIAPELRRTAQFERLNLIDGDYPFDTDIDVIFCRNVLIYFDRPTQHAVITRLASHLRCGGYLLVGHSESMAGSGVDRLRQVRPTIFQAADAIARTRRA